MEEKIIVYIDLHYAEPINLDMVADSVGVSKYYLSRNFRKIANYNFCEYINRKRVSEAARLLDKGTKESITDIALQSGFQSISTFNRLFKEVMGCSPKEYRTKCS